VDLHRAEYVTVDLPNDPPTDAEYEAFWAHAKESVSAGFGMVLNFVAPASNPPFPIKGSGPCPSFYSYGTTYHYTSLLGFSDEGGERAVWICDSGGAPFGYWITARQCAILCAGKGYSYPKLKAPQGVPVLPGPAPAPTSGATADLLFAAMGGSLSVERYAELLPSVLQSLAASGCTTENRVAEWIAQVGHESGGLRYSEEIADGSAYEGREDLGNVHPGDGQKYKGHGWIQITGYSNHEQVSQWAHSQGLVPTPTFFLDQPTLLGSDKYAGLGPAWYWSVARPQINAMADAQDHEGVCRAVNGGLNGYDDRVARFNNALPIAAAFLPANNSSATAPPPVPAAPAAKPHPAATGDATLDELIGAAPHHATTLGEYGANPYVAFTVQDKLSHVARENTMWLPARTLSDILRDVIEDPDRPDTVLGHSINAASLARVNFELLRRICDHLKIDTKDVI
jgi:predicted chitinase